MGQIIPYKEKMNNLRALIHQCKHQIQRALPRHLTAERMIRVAETAIQQSPKLLECNQLSVIGAIVQASQLGLETDGVLGRAYLVPYKEKAQLIVGYKGLIDLARRSGQISNIYADIVCEKDEFEFEKGLCPKLMHRPTREEDPGKMIAAYAVAKLRDGAEQFEVMWKRQIDVIRKRSMAGNNGPWVTDYDEMAKKTVIRRLCKYLPMSVELDKAVSLDEMADAGVSQNMDTVIDINSEAISETEEPVEQDTLV